MKQLIQNSSFAKISRGLTMGLASCAFLSQLAYAQKPTVVSATTDKGITTTTYSDGKVVKSLAEGYQFDTLFYKPGGVVQATSPRYWRFTAKAGWANDLQFLASKVDFQLGFGQYANLTANYYFLGGGVWGIGATVGAQNFFNNSNSDPNLSSALAAKNVALSGVELLTSTAQRDYMFLVGPSAKFAISDKIDAVLDGKFGFTFSYAPTKTYVTKATNELVYQRATAGKQYDWGIALGGELMYKLNPSWSVGLNLQGTYTNTPYIIQKATSLTNESIFLGYRRHISTNIGVAAAYTLPTVKPVLSQLAPPPAPPVVTPPVLNQGAKMFDYGSKEIPTFSWKSTSPSAKNEEFIFKLYKADGSGVPVYQQTTKSNSISLPKSVSLVNGDDASFYYYTVQSSIGKYLSEPTSSSFGYKAKPTPVTPVPVQDQYIVKIFNGKAAAVTTVKRKPVRKSTSTAVTASGSKPLVPRKRTGKKPAVAKAPVVNYENVATDPSIKWPSDLPLPQKPSVYEYEVQRLSAGDCKPTGQVAKYKFYIDPKKPNDIRIIPDSPKK